MFPYRIALPILSACTLVVTGCGGDSPAPEDSVKTLITNYVAASFPAACAAISDDGQADLNAAVLAIPGSDEVVSCEDTLRFLRRATTKADLEDIRTSGREIVDVDPRVVTTKLGKFGMEEVNGKLLVRDATALVPASPLPVQSSTPAGSPSPTTDRIDAVTARLDKAKIPYEVAADSPNKITLGPRPPLDYALHIYAAKDVGTAGLWVLSEADTPGQRAAVAAGRAIVKVIGSNVYSLRAKRKLSASDKLNVDRLIAIAEGR